MICFACETEYSDELKVCPNCGFNPEEEDEPYCPFSIDCMCIGTKEMCFKTEDFSSCEEFIKLENGDFEDEPED